MFNCPEKLLEINARKLRPLVDPRLLEELLLPPPQETSQHAAMRIRKIPAAARFKPGDSTRKLQSDEEVERGDYSRALVSSSATLHL